MKKNQHILFGILLILISTSTVFAQETIKLPIATSSTPQGYSDLLTAPSKIAENALMNEQLLDLVQVYLTDSVIKRKTQRHRVVGAALLPALGYKWLTINYRKEKFVATLSSNLIVPKEGSDLYTEYDVNWNLTSLLPRYQELEMAGYQRQKEIGRKKKRYDNYTKAPFVPIGPDSDLEKYHLHCEHTPLYDYRPMINQMFMPVIRPMNTKDHPSFMDDRPSVGIYGAFISDCNHTCHPEIHPYEWIWWMNHSDQVQTSPNSKVWMLGLLREGSNRFPKWSPSPRIGEASIPFAFPADKNEWKIVIEHLVFGPFEEAGLSQLEIPENAFDMNFRELTFSLDNPELQGKNMVISSNTPINAPGIKAWIGELNYDKASGLVTGNLHFGASVKDLWTCRITTDF